MPPSVDIVYLWVDGADPAWQARRLHAAKQQAQQLTASLAAHGDVQGRYRDNGELRYNLRALARFFPQHGHVYIVTDGQCPAWLRPGPGLTVIDHRELIPASALPVYDSGHIESYLHHIPGLSERFIYLNDDVFFGAPVDPGFWFSADGVAVFHDNATVPAHDGPQPSASALVNASLRSQAWLSSRHAGYRHRSQVFAHAPRPFLKSTLHELERAATCLFAELRSTTFRTWSIPPLIPDLAPRWLLTTGRARLREGHALYIGSGDPRAPLGFQELTRRFGQLSYFCINDTSDNAPADAPELLRIGRTLEALLPVPSRFECPSAGIQVALAA